MSDREIIMRTLAQVRRRLRLNHALYDLVILLGLLVIGLLLARVLHVLGSRVPALTTVSILAAVLLWVLGVFLLVRSRWTARATLMMAAAAADQRAGLKDELKTAYWFIENPAPSPWIAAQIERAARSARALDPSALLPVRLGQRTLAAAAISLMVLAVVWVIPPLTPLSQAVAQPDSALSSAEDRQVKRIRELMAQLEDDSATVQQLEQALNTLERADSSIEDKQRALAEAQQALEQHNLQAASTREGLYQLSQKLRGTKSLEEIADALKEGDAHRAARLMQRIADAGSGAQRGEVATHQRAKEKDLEGLLQDAAKGEDQPQQREISSAAAKEAVDRLDKIAEQLDVQQRVNQAAQALGQLQLAVAQRSVLSAGRFGQQAANNATPSPESGRTSMPGGTMYRAAAVARENAGSQQQEGSKTGSAMGDSYADPVLGNKVIPLEVQLKKEAIPSDKPEDQDSPAKNWFYAESQEQTSTLQTQEVNARANFAAAQSSAPEGISIRHRQIVKDYFMNLREGSPR